MRLLILDTLQADSRHIKYKALIFADFSSESVYGCVDVGDTSVLTSGNYYFTFYD
jgi:hypothetical protein